jgi:hypothetical protein
VVNLDCSPHVITKVEVAAIADLSDAQKHGLLDRSKSRHGFHYADGRREGFGRGRPLRFLEEGTSSPLWNDLDLMGQVSRCPLTWKAA